MKFGGTDGASDQSLVLATPALRVRLVCVRRWRRIRRMLQPVPLSVQLIGTELVVNMSYDVIDDIFALILITFTILS